MDLLKNRVVGLVREEEEMSELLKRFSSIFFFFPGKFCCQLFQSHVLRGQVWAMVKEV